MSASTSLKRLTAAGLLVWLTSCCDSEAIPRYLSNLDSSKSRDRTEAALALARCGSRANGSVPRLAELLYDENAGVQSAAAYALREIDTPKARAIMKEIDDSRRKK